MPVKRRSSKRKATKQRYLPIQDKHIKSQAAFPSSGPVNHNIPANLEGRLQQGSMLSRLNQTLGTMYGLQNESALANVQAHFNSVRLQQGASPFALPHQQTAGGGLYASQAQEIGSGLCVSQVQGSGLYASQAQEIGGKLQNKREVGSVGIGGGLRRGHQALVSQPFANANFLQHF